MTDDPNNHPIVRYPASMTGKKLRKQLGFPEKVRTFSDTTFKVAAKFRGIPVEQRLAFLRARTTVRVETLRWDEVASRRAGFNSHKIKSLPMRKDCSCYVCGGVAVLRHHVVTIMHGGRNKRNNIVPLCNDCHELVHHPPHQQYGAL